MAESVQQLCAWGLTLDSELDIPGAVRLPRSARQAADLTVTLDDAGQTPAATSVADAVDGPYERRTQQLLFSAPGVARYRATNGNALSVTPQPGAALNEVIELLIATALPMVLWMRGDTVLHAAGVVPQGADQAIAIAGPSGAGKSSIAAEFLRRGATLIGDDTLRVSQRGRRLEVSGLPASYFVRDGSAESRRAIAVPEQQIGERAELGAIVVVEPTEIESDGPPKRLSGAAAVAALLRNRHRPRVPALLGHEQRSFEHCLLLARSVPVYSIRQGRHCTSATWVHLAESIQSIDTHGVCS